MKKKTVEKYFCKIDDKNCEFNVRKKNKQNMHFCTNFNGFNITRLSIGKCTFYEELIFFSLASDVRF